MLLRAGLAGGEHLAKEQWNTWKTSIKPGLTCLKQAETPLSAPCLQAKAPQVLKDTGRKAKGVVKVRTKRNSHAGAGTAMSEMENKYGIQWTKVWINSPRLSTVTKPELRQIR